MPMRSGKHKIVIGKSGKHASKKAKKNGMAMRRELIAATARERRVASGKLLLGDRVRRANKLASALEQYERKVITAEQLEDQIGMSYADGLRLWYAMRVAESRLCLHQMQAAGLLTRAERDAIVGEGTP